jgi:hypothetical protein
MVGTMPAVELLAPDESVTMTRRILNEPRVEGSRPRSRRAGPVPRVEEDSIAQREGRRDGIDSPHLIVEPGSRGWLPGKRNERLVERDDRREYAAVATIAMPMGRCRRRRSITDHGRKGKPSPKRASKKPFREDLDCKVQEGAQVSIRPEEDRERRVVAHSIALRRGVHQADEDGGDDDAPPSTATSSSSNPWARTSSGRGR